MKLKRKKNPVGRLLSIPGIKEAIELVREHALNRAIDEALEEGAKSEIEELRHLLTDESDDFGHNLDKFFNNELVQSLIAESADAWLEGLAREAGPKIAMLWGLSEFAGERLAELIYAPEFCATSYFSPIKLIVKTDSPEKEKLLRNKWLELLAYGAITGPVAAMEKDHVYLDVTHLSYEGFRHAYKAVVELRNYLGIENRDIQEGATESIDTSKALACAVLALEGKPNKEIARELGFRIYRRDNPSGSYPLLRKYLKRGRELLQKLTALDRFLESISFSD